MTPLRHSRLLPAAALCCALVGCGALNYPGPTSFGGNLPAQGPIVPDTTLNLTPGLGISLERSCFGVPTPARPI